MPRPPKLPGETITSRIAPRKQIPACFWASSVPSQISIRIRPASFSRGDHATARKDRRLLHRVVAADVQTPTSRPASASSPQWLGGKGNCRSVVTTVLILPTGVPRSRVYWKKVGPGAKSPFGPLDCVWAWAAACGQPGQAGSILAGVREPSRRPAV